MKADARAHTPHGPAIRFDQVSLTLGRTDILKGIDLHVAAGSVHALVGPNGGGKSSLIKTLLGLTPHRGTLALDWPEGSTQCTGYVPQSLEFDPGLPITIDDFMAAMCQRRPAFAGISPRYRDAIDAALLQVGMQDKRSRRMGSLSGGERQRVLLAQGLIPAPDLLVLDEPMSALDETGVRIFEQLLAQWRASGVTVLWIEHDLAAVGRLADHVSGLNKQILFDGPPAAVLGPDALLNLFSSLPRSTAANTAQAAVSP